jgi:dihydrodipicolinate reductase
MKSQMSLMLEQTQCKVTIVALQNFCVGVIVVMMLVATLRNMLPWLQTAEMLKG